MLALVIIAFLAGLSTRKMVEVDILKDRGVLVRENAKGWLENAYSLRIINKSEKEQLITASVKGFDEIALTGLPEGGIKVAPRETVTLPVQVSTIPEYADKGSHPIEFTFQYRESARPTASRSSWKKMQPLSENNRVSKHSNQTLVQTRLAVDLDGGADFCRHRQRRYVFCRAAARDRFGYGRLL